MSYQISVHRVSDEEFFATAPCDVVSPEFDVWLKKSWQLALYDNPLGSTFIVYSYWHLSSQLLGLPLLSSIYESELSIPPSKLDELEKELDFLESYWQRTSFPTDLFLKSSTINEDGSTTEESIYIKDHLKERMGYMREAIRIARNEDGIISIS